MKSYIWDGLALIDKNTTAITNEPYVTGGSPIIAGDKVLFNDILGTTQGTTDGKEFSAIKRDAFGQTLDNDADADYDYFTGKPKVKDLGYAFLFRNYRANLGKWQTQDPIGIMTSEPGFCGNKSPITYRLGYPDGWNNLTYVKNHIISSVDELGAGTIKIPGITDYAELTTCDYMFNSSYNASTGYTEVSLIVLFQYTVYSTWAVGGWFGYCDDENCQGHYFDQFSTVGTTQSPPLSYITYIEGEASVEEIAAAWSQQQANAEAQLAQIKADLEANDDKFLTRYVMCE